MLSPLQKKRLNYKPVIPKVLKDLKRLQFKEVAARFKPDERLKRFFPNSFEMPFYELIAGKRKLRSIKIGVVFSGGPAPGGHNVISGIFDTKAELIGFLDGPNGILENQYIEINDLSQFRNQGGFDLIGTGRSKIETQEQLIKAMQTVQEHKLDGIVIIGGDDSNTNAAVLAEFFIQNRCKTCVVGVPKTIDADLRSLDIEISFGFDSATKTYSEQIGNIARDAISSKKYYHFIKLMGRSASHIILECALRTKPNLALISEERNSFKEIVQKIVNLILERSKLGKNYGVILVPEGLVEFVPELDELMRDLPVGKDPHGNLEVSKIDIQKILINYVEKELKKLKFQKKFVPISHSLGYEGRSCMPTNFDACYCYALGRLASIAVAEGLNGVICSIQNLKKAVHDWTVKMIPIIHLMHLEKRLGKEKPVIQKTLVDIKSKIFINYSHLRKNWELNDSYEYSGPIQFFGSPELVDSVPLTLE